MRLPGHIDGGVVRGWDGREVQRDVHPAGGVAGVAGSVVGIPVHRDPEPDVVVVPLAVQPQIEREGTRRRGGKVERASGHPGVDVGRVRSGRRVLAANAIRGVGSGSLR